MKKYIFATLAFVCSTLYAFPNYKQVKCTNTSNGHTLTVEYFRAIQLLTVSLDGQTGKAYVNESNGGNRIYSNPEYDAQGNQLVIEIISNSVNWQATLNLYTNNQLSGSLPLNCLKIKADNTPTQSMTSILSKIGQ